MIRLFLKLLPVLALFAGYYYAQKNGLIGTGSSQPAVEGGPQQALPPADRTSATIKIASFNIQVFGEEKVKDAKTTDVLVKIIRGFDVVAIQEIRAKDPQFIPRFVQQVNSTGMQYSFALGPRLGNTTSQEQYAFLFNLARVEIDPTSVYTVGDPANMLHREPLVAGFRTRAAPPGEAFTFTLVNMHTDPDVAKAECDALAAVFRAVRDDGRGEDDIILLGDFNANPENMGQLRALPYISYVVSGVPTMVEGNRTNDNILFDRRATTEFVNWDIVNVMRLYNLTQAEVLKVSDHLPVWADFSIYERGRPGSLVTRPTQAQSR